MRLIVNFLCEDVQLSGTLDDASGNAGLLIVSGGNEIRIGAHRGMAEMAAMMAALGHPVFRFDRRGIGDSEGSNAGFRQSGPDITAALAAFRASVPTVRRIVAFGNCDAATALVLHDPDIDAFVLANPWVIEPIDELPATAAIKRHYLQRLRDPAAWRSMMSGRMNLRSAFKGLRRVARPPHTSSALAAIFAHHLGATTKPTTILLAGSDNTAVAFADIWKTSMFDHARQRRNVDVISFNSASHSFAGAEDAALLRETLLAALTS